MTFMYSVSDGTEEVIGDIIVEVSGTFRTFNVGDTGPAGGTVFRVSEDGERGLEFAPEFISNTLDPAQGFQAFAWGCLGVDLDMFPNLEGFDQVTGEPLGSVQSGATSTQGIQNVACLDQAAESPASAAILEASAYFRIQGNTNFGDWYLPSITELIELQRLFPDAVIQEDNSSVSTAVLGELTLWSSTEHTDELVWALGPFEGLPVPPVLVPRKDEASGTTVLNSFSVLPVRSFDTGFF